MKKTKLFSLFFMATVLLIGIPSKCVLAKVKTPPIQTIIDDDESYQYDACCSYWGSSGCSCQGKPHNVTSNLTNDWACVTGCQGHNFDSPNCLILAITYSTCMYTGSKTVQCLTCHEKKNISIPIIAHTYGGNWIADGDSGHYQLCTMCNKEKGNFGLHTYGSWDPSTGTRECTKCHYVQHCDHSWTTSYKDTGNASKHNKVETCSICGMTKTTSESHHFKTKDTGVIEKVAQCTVPGTKYDTKECEDCHYIKKSSYTYTASHDFSGASSTTYSYTKYSSDKHKVTVTTSEKCKNCNETNSTSTSGYESHSWSSWSGWQNGDSVGYNGDIRYRTCTKCGEQETDRKAHNYRMTAGTVLFVIASPVTRMTKGTVQSVIAPSVSRNTQVCICFLRRM